MGMFDSFLIQHEGVEREIQRKDFFNVMDRYQAGELVEVIEEIVAEFKNDETPWV